MLFCTLLKWWLSVCIAIKAILLMSGYFIKLIKNEWRRDCKNGLWVAETGVFGLLRAHSLQGNRPETDAQAGVLRIHTVFAPHRRVQAFIAGRSRAEAAARRKILKARKLKYWGQEKLIGLISRFQLFYYIVWAIFGPQFSISVLRLKNFGRFATSPSST